MEGHRESEGGHQTDWADVLWESIVKEADIGILKTQSRPRLCVFLVLTSFRFWEGDRLVNVVKEKKRCHGSADGIVFMSSSRGWDFRTEVSSTFYV